MSKWIIYRLLYGDEEFTLTEGEEVTIGRSLTNTITLSSIIISRNHCILAVQKDNVWITDLNSSNGVYIGREKIPENKPYALNHSDIFGIGWIYGETRADVKNEDKFVFKLCLFEEPVFEYSGYVDEPFQVDSDSDSESEQWLVYPRPRYYHF